MVSNLLSTKFDWATFGFDRQRTSYNPNETVLTATSVTGLVKKWSFQLGYKYTNTQPIVAAHVKLASGTFGELVYVGDEQSDLYAVDAKNGKPVWSQKLGVTSNICGGPFSDGITGAPVVDRATNRLYVIDGLATISAFDLGTGVTSPGFPPKTVYGNTSVNHTWSALLLSPDGKTLYYPTASHCDKGTYYGTINGIDTTSQAITTFNLVTNPATYYGNGVWSWGGETIDPDTGNLFAGVGNSQGSLAEHGQYSDSIIELTNALGFVADDQPETNLGKNDWDFGTTPVPYDDQGQCLALERKDGSFFSIDRTNLHNGAFATKLNLGGQLATPAYSPATHALYASVPAGLTKLSVGPGCTVSIAWQTPIGANGNSVPVVAGGVVYAAGGSKLYAIDANTGSILWTSGSTIGGSIVAAPTVVNGHVYAAAWNGRLYAFGL